jgi:hypothetical protein
MRLVCWLLLVSALFSSGCAMMIATTGKDLTKLKTKNDLHAWLGEPEKAGVENGQEFEEFRTRWKIADRTTRYVGPGYAMGLVITCGTCDLVLVPYELYLIGQRTVLGQTIRVTYNQKGEVTGESLDGQPFFALFFDASQEVEQSSPPVSTTAIPSAQTPASPVSPASGP